MRDIYHQLVMSSPDFAGYSETDLIECRDLCGDAVCSITSALTLIGNLTLDATMSEGYANEDARRDLVLLGNTLRHLPRMAQAMEQSCNTANYVLKQRLEGVK
ncbi:hypothetical protein [Yokenella regensburgei]|uniref:hypothetical protein n=1 Tax=Yokenella regensburgei TaxID=158877 RepID=UPI002898A220|nr:hypothetical protein [Yokenella regensburgei]